MSIPPTSLTWPATPDDVAALLRARTQDTTGQEVGAWTTDTRPDLNGVTQTLAMCTSVVLGQTGDVTDLVCPSADDVRAQAATAVALLAAMLIELSYFPEQVASNRSAYDQYAALWNATMPQLVQSVAECRGGEVEAGGGADSTVVPPSSWAFPVDTGGMVGWGTRW